MSYTRVHGCFKRNNLVIVGVFVGVVGTLDLTGTVNAMEETLFERVGGQEFFSTLVEYFYEGVETEEILRAMYPEDLEPSKVHLALFLAQYWGGPATYQEVRGHPRLRMRHAEFMITKTVRDAWLLHMNAAVARMEMNDDDRAELLAYLDMAAHQLRNR